jgi:hypothetical protein
MSTGIFDAKSISVENLEYYLNLEWLETMEKYNKIYFVVWLLFSAIALSFMVIFVLSELGEILDNVALSFFLLFLTSEIVGFIFASLTINHISRSYNMHIIFTLTDHITIPHHV